MYFQTREKASRNKSTNYTIVINLWLNWWSTRISRTVLYTHNIIFTDLTATVHTYMYIRWWDDVAGFSCDVYGYVLWKKGIPWWRLQFFFMNGSTIVCFIFFLVFSGFVFMFLTFGFFFCLLLHCFGMIIIPFGRIKGGTNIVSALPLRHKYSNIII